MQHTDDHSTTVGQTVGDPRYSVRALREKGDKRDALIVESLGKSEGVWVEAALVKALKGNGNAAIFLSQILFWAKNTKDPDGWTYNTQKALEQQTGLSENSQRTARRLLVKLGVIEEELRGSPPKVYIRVNLQRLVELRLDALDDASVDERAYRLPTMQARVGDEKSTSHDSVDEPEKPTSDKRVDNSADKASSSATEKDRAASENEDSDEVIIVPEVAVGEGGDEEFNSSRLLDLTPASSESQLQQPRGVLYKGIKQQEENKEDKKIAAKAATKKSSVKKGKPKSARTTGKKSSGSEQPSGEPTQHQVLFGLMAEWSSGGVEGLTDGRKGRLGKMVKEALKTAPPEIWEIAANQLFEEQFWAAQRGNVNPNTLLDKLKPLAVKILKNKESRAAAETTRRGQQASLTAYEARTLREAAHSSYEELLGVFREYEPLPRDESQSLSAYVMSQVKHDFLSLHLTNCYKLKPVWDKIMELFEGYGVQEWLELHPYGGKALGEQLVE